MKPVSRATFCPRAIYAHHSASSRNRVCAINSRKLSLPLIVAPWQPEDFPSHSHSIISQTHNRLFRLEHCTSLLLYTVNATAENDHWRPIERESCRSKKLRCDRVDPSNKNSAAGPRSSARKSYRVTRVSTVSQRTKCHARGLQAIAGRDTSRDRTVMANAIGDIRPLRAILARSLDSVT